MIGCKPRDHEVAISMGHFQPKNVDGFYAPTLLANENKIEMIECDFSSHRCAYCLESDTLIAESNQTHGLRHGSGQKV